jgi:hypothetical protein
MNQTQTPDPRVKLAEMALKNLYDSWDIHGGPSPDTRDEAREVAHVLDAEEVTDEQALEGIWNVAQDGVGLDVLAATHIAAIDARDGVEPAPVAPAINVLIHLNVTFPTSVVQDAENMAWDLCREHGILKHVVMIEAE